MSSNIAVEVAAGHSLTMTHIFDAPRELVWETWTKEEHLAEWWGPENFTNICEVDLRPGGTCRIDMKGPDGEVYPAPGKFVEVLEPERLVISQTPLDAAGNVMFETVQTAVFTEQGEKTLLTLTAYVTSTTPHGEKFLVDLPAPWATIASQVLQQSMGKLDRLLGALVEQAARANETP